MCVRGRRAKEIQGKEESVMKMILVEWNWFLRVKLSKLDVQTDFCVY